MPLCRQCNPITIELMISGHKNVIVSCLYRTPGSNTNDFSEILYNLFSELSVSKTIFICGDFNLDILKHNSNHATKYILDTMYSVGLYPLIDRPSRITNHSSTLIDNIFTNAKEYNNVSGLLVNDITDHLPIFAFCDYPNPKRQEKKLYTKKRVINQNTIDLLADKLSEVDRDNVLNLSEVDLAYNAFVSTCVRLYNQCCPIRLVKHFSRKNDKPWLTNSLRNACHKKNVLYKKSFDAAVVTHLDDSPCDLGNASASLTRLTKCVTDAARETLPSKRCEPLRKRQVSERTEQLYDEQRKNYARQSDDERRAATRAITVSSRNDYREYVNSVLDCIEGAEAVGNMRTK